MLLSKAPEPQTRFVVVGTQRSGTTMIQTALDAHPDICCDGEIFQMRHLLRKIPKRNFEGEGYRWWLGKHRVQWINHAFNRKVSVNGFLNDFIEKQNIRISGFKIMWNQTERFPGIIQFLEEHNFRLLHIRRRNVLRSLVSRYVARARDIYHATEKVESPKVEVPLDKVLPMLGIISKHNRNWEQLGNELSYLRIDYEDYILEPQSRGLEIISFLGASSEFQLKSPLIKLTPDDLRLVVSNYDELEALLKGTEFEEMLGT